MTERVVRTGARVILVDDEGRTLLFCGGDPDRPAGGRWWFTPGGGVEPGETVEQAAHREVREETGIVVEDLGPPLREEDTEFDFAGQRVVQHQWIYCARVPSLAAGGVADVSDAGWTDLERRSVQGWRWWASDQIRATTETIYPADLADLVDAFVLRSSGG